MAIATINPATGETLKTFQPITDQEIETKLGNDLEISKDEINNLKQQHSYKINLFKIKEANLQSAINTTRRQNLENKNQKNSIKNAISIYCYLTDDNHQKFTFHSDPKP